MKSYLALAWKELKAQKITAILILVAVIMSTIMTTVIGQSIGILQSMRIQQAAGLNGNRYATFHQLGKEQAQKLHEDDRLYDVGDTIFIGSTPLGNSSLSLYLREYHDNALSMYPAIGNVKEGRLPEEAIEIALSEDALQYLGLDAVIGDTVSLDLSVSVMDGSLSELEYSADFVLTGILESSYIGYASGTVEGIVGEGTAEELLPEEYLLYSTDFKTYDKQNFQSIIYALAEDLNVDERYIQYNWVLLDAIGISYDEAADSDTGTGFSFMTAACILVGVLVLLAAGLVIYNILKILYHKTHQRNTEHFVRLVENEGKSIVGFFAAFDSLWSRYSYRIAARYIVGKRCIDCGYGASQSRSVHGKQHFRIELCNQHRQYGKTTDALCQYRSHTSVCSAGCLSCCPVRIPCISYCCYVGADCENQTQDKKEPQHP